MVLRFLVQNTLRYNKRCRTLNQRLLEPTDEPVGHITSQAEIQLTPMLTYNPSPFRKNDRSSTERREKNRFGWTFWLTLTPAASSGMSRPRLHEAYGKSGGPNWVGGELFRPSWTWRPPRQDPAEQGLPFSDVFPWTEKVSPALYHWAAQSLTGATRKERDLGPKARVH